MRVDAVLGSDDGREVGVKPLGEFVSVLVGLNEHRVGVAVENRETAADEPVPGPLEVLAPEAGDRAGQLRLSVTAITRPQDTVKRIHQNLVDMAGRFVSNSLGRDTGGEITVYQPWQDTAPAHKRSPVWCPQQIGLGPAFRADVGQGIDAEGSHQRRVEASKIKDLDPFKQACLWIKDHAPGGARDGSVIFGGW